MIDIKTKKEELEKKFEATKNDIAKLREMTNEKMTELVRLQGEYRLLLELEKSTENKDKN